MTDDSEVRVVGAFGREIMLVVGQELDHVGQFLVGLYIDGLPVWEAHMTDKSEEEE